MISHYHVLDEKVDRFLKSASNNFNQFKTSHDETFLDKSLDDLSQAINVERDRINYFLEKRIPTRVFELDLAFCLRRFAATIIRHKKLADRFESAKLKLIEALTIHDKFSTELQAENHPTRKEVHLEKQRVLSQLRKVAFEQKNG